jgi:hypothetical protein
MVPVPPKCACEQGLQPGAPVPSAATPAAEVAGSAHWQFEKKKEERQRFGWKSRSMTKQEYLDRVWSQLHVKDGKVVTNLRSGRAPDYMKLATEAMALDLLVAPKEIAADMERRAAAKARLNTGERSDDTSWVHPTLMHALDAAVARCGVVVTPDGILKNTESGLTLDRNQLVTAVLFDVNHVKSQDLGYLLCYGKPQYKNNGQRWFYKLEGKELVAGSIDVWLDFHKTEQWVTTRQRLKHDGGDWRQLVGQVIEALGTSDGPTTRYAEACAYAMAHWMWLVKRRLYTRRTRWELFLILHGRRQGDGKSWFIKNLLCKPLAYMYARKTVDIFGDAREHKVWENNLVIDFDELAKNHNGNRGFIESQLLDAMKSTLTSEVMDPRLLGGNVQHRFERMASCIGSTNHSLEHHFADDTGMRRFFVLNVGEIDQAALNGLDYEALWRSIDEDLEDGYAGDGVGRDLVAQVQATYKPHTVVDE